VTRRLSPECSKPRLRPCSRREAGAGILDNLAATKDMCMYFCRACQCVNNNRIFRVTDDLLLRIEPGLPLLISSMTGNALSHIYCSHG
jgi:hypothetical protein